MKMLIKVRFTSPNCIIVSLDRYNAVSRIPCIPRSHLLSILPWQGFLPATMHSYLCNFSGVTAQTATSAGLFQNQQRLCTGLGGGIEIYAQSVNVSSILDRIPTHF